MPSILKWMLSTSILIEYTGGLLNNAFKSLNILKHCYGETTDHPLLAMSGLEITKTYIGRAEPLDSNHQITF